MSFTSCGSVHHPRFFNGVGTGVFSTSLYFICFLRLILCPVLSILFLLVSRAIYVHPEAHIILEVVVLAGASSSASTVTQMVQVFGENAKYASIINVMSVILCIFTMPMITFLYEIMI